MKLPLALDIAALVLEAQRNSNPVDVSAQADQLIAIHPEAEASAADVVEVLSEELRATTHVHEETKAAGG